MPWWQLLIKHPNLNVCRAAIAQGADLWRRRVPAALVAECDKAASEDAAVYCRLYVRLYCSSLLSNGHMLKVTKALCWLSLSQHICVCFSATCCPFSIIGQSQLSYLMWEPRCQTSHCFS